MSIELKRGWWEADDGSRWFVIGQDAKGFWVADSEARNGHTWFDDEGRIKRCLDGTKMRAQLARFLEGCTGFDWQPSKSLAFLRDVLKPPAGKTLGWLFAKYSGTIERDREFEARGFLKELTGLDFSTEAKP